MLAILASYYDAMRLNRKAHAATRHPRVMADTWGDTLPWEQTLLVLGCSWPRAISPVSSCCFLLSPGCRDFAQPASYKLGRAMEPCSVEQFVPLTGVQQIQT